MTRKTTAKWSCRSLPLRCAFIYSEQRFCPGLKTQTFTCGCVEQIFCRYSGLICLRVCEAYAFHLACARGGEQQQARCCIQHALHMAVPFPHSHLLQHRQYARLCSFIILPLANADALVSAVVAAICAVLYFGHRLLLGEWPHVAWLPLDGASLLSWRNWPAYALLGFKAFTLWRMMFRTYRVSSTDSAPYMSIVDRFGVL